VSDPRWTSCASLSRPLTILGCERKLFLAAATAAVVMFQATEVLLAPLFLFVVLAGGGRWATSVDPHAFGVLMQARRYCRRYDPGKPARES